MNIPILFIVFNRPETTTEVFSTIRRARPKKLFIAADGPRKNIPGDRILCKEVRNIVSEVDWPCEVKRLYNNRNCGCKKAVSNAIDWFFDNVSEGIILEDDCVPSPAFFEFSRRMLSKYRDEEGIMHINGNNFQPVENKVINGYYFSRYAHVWGWATWKRAWKKYDVGMKDWPRTRKQEQIDYIFSSLLEKEYWYTLFEAVYQGKIDTWDYQWVYTIWKNKGCAITPGVNLVENIGHTKNSTHTAFRKLLTQREKFKFPVVLLKNKRRQKQFDDVVSRSHYGINFPMVFYQKAKLMLGKF